MGSAKLILRPKENADGTHSLNIQVVKDRKTSLIFTGHRIKKGDWDAVNRTVKRSHPNSAKLNNNLRKLLNETADKMIDMDTNKKKVSGRDIKKAMMAERDGTFFKQASAYLDHLRKRGKFNRVSADEPRINRFREFLRSDIAFADITPSVLRQFSAHLNAEYDASERTVMNYLVVIRTIYNQAVADGLADKKNYPFGRGKVIIKFPDTSKYGLSPDELKALESAELPSGQNHARNLFLVSFYFAGMRASDLLRLKWSDFQDGRLYYKMGKNEKAGSVKVPEKVLAILENYPKDNAHDLVFFDIADVEDVNDGMEVQRRIKTRIRSANDYLKQITKTLEIKKTLTMHISRHSFAQIAGDNISVQVLQSLYRHTSIVTTIGYQGQFANKKIDDGLDTVLNF